MTARVEVTLKGALAGRLPAGRATVEVEDGASADALLAALGLPAATRSCGGRAQPSQRRSASTAFCPPKPKLSFSATRGSTRRARLGT